MHTPSCAEVQHSSLWHSQLYQQVPAQAASSSTSSSAGAASWCICLCSCGSASMLCITLLH
jgi:hypothetical protein